MKGVEKGVEVEVEVEVASITGAGAVMWELVGFGSEAG